MAKILVIDDSTATLDLIRETLTAAGHEVVAAHSGKRAEAILGSQRLDLVITDIYMPDGDGLEVLREARRTRPGLRVIAISGVTGRYDMLGVVRALGATRTLRKPFTAARLLEAVNACLSETPAGEAKHGS